MSADITTGILLRDVAHMHEVHDAMAVWLDIQKQIEAFDGELDNQRRPENEGPTFADQACYGITLSREEVRSILVQRREKAEMTLANKGVKVGRMEGVR